MSQTFPGFLIAIEGIDGSGKSTLAHNLAQKLEEEKHTVVLTKQPGGSQLGQQLRNILHTQKNLVCDTAEFLLFAADRAQHAHEVVIPALKNGSIVISDRMGDSSIAYQGYGRGLDTSMIALINQWAMQGIKPDLTIYLRLNPKSGLARVLGRKETLTSFEQEAAAFWQRVADGYEMMYAGRDDVIILDATQSQEALCKQAMQKIKDVHENHKLH